MAKPKFVKKDKFSDLAVEFRDAIAGASTDEIRKRVSTVALLEVTEKQLLKADPEVGQAKQALKDLMEPYRENLKEYKLQIEYCKLALDEKGGGNPVARVKDAASKIPGATSVKVTLNGEDLGSLK